MRLPAVGRADGEVLPEVGAVAVAGDHRGAVVEVTQDVRRQGRVLAVGAERFALDVRTCTLIAVEPVTAAPSSVAPQPVGQGSRA